MKKQLYPLLLLVMGLGSIQAQDEAIYTHYLINPVLVNPAAAGFSGDYQFFGHVRMHQTGVSEFPNTYTFAYNGPLGQSFGLGGLFMADNAAQLNRIRGQLQFAFRFDIKEDIKLGIGFSTDIQQWRLDSEVRNSNIYDLGDDVLESYINGRWFFDASLGVYATFRERAFAGIGIINLVQARLDNIVTENAPGGPFQYYTVFGGYHFTLEDKGIDITPSVLLRQARNAPFNVDFNVMAGFLDRQFQVGLSYRTVGAMSMLVGTTLSSFSFYYSYDFSFQDFSQYDAGSHEFTVAFNLKPRPRNGNIRIRDRR